MRQALTELVVPTNGPGLTEITREVTNWIDEAAFRDGLLTLHCRHTSASLLVTENASSAVWSDLTAWLDRIAPQSGIYDHDAEGPDDMPAHLKNALAGVNVSIPVANGRMCLGTWQGIFLAEHRKAPHRRTVVIHLIGE